MCLVSVPALATQVLPISMPDPTQAGFASADQAVVAAYVVARALSHSDEAGGAIYTTAGKFFYTLPVTAHHGTAVDYRIAKPVGSTLVALYHTHPGYTPGYGGFSMSDCDLASSMNLLMYVNVIEDKRILVFDPKHDSGRRMGRASHEDNHGGRQITTTE